MAAVARDRGLRLHGRRRPRRRSPTGSTCTSTTWAATQLESALFALRPFGRVIACGAISRYNDAGPQPGPRNLGLIVTKRLRVEGFIVLDHVEPLPRVRRRRSGRWVRDGKLDYRETVVDGIDTGCRTRSPVSSAATTSGRCSSASGPTDAQGRTNAISVEPSSVCGDDREAAHTRRVRRRHVDRYVHRRQAGDAAVERRGGRRGGCAAGSSSSAAASAAADLRRSRRQSMFATPSMSPFGLTP